MTRKGWTQLVEEARRLCIRGANSKVIFCWHCIRNLRKRIGETWMRSTADDTLINGWIELNLRDGLSELLATVSFKSKLERCALFLLLFGLAFAGLDDLVRDIITLSLLHFTIY